MRVLIWIKILLFGMVSAVILSMLGQLLDSVIRPSRGLLFLDLKYVVYFIVSLVAAASGAIVSIAALISRSRTLTMIAALLVALTVSTGLFKGAYETYSNTTFFDAPTFYSDIVQIILNLIIYPVVALSIWKVFRKVIVNG